MTNAIDALRECQKTLEKVLNLVGIRCTSTEEDDPCKLCGARVATDACGVIELSRYNPIYRDVEDAISVAREALATPTPRGELDGGDIVERLRNHPTKMQTFRPLLDEAADLLEQKAKREKELVQALDIASSRGCSHCADAIRRARLAVPNPSRAEE